MEDEIKNKVVSAARALKISFEVLNKYNKDFELILSIVKNKIIKNKNMIKLITGLKNIIGIDNYDNYELRVLKEIFRIFSFVEGICINILVLPNGKLLCYNEDVLKKFFLEKGKDICITKEGLEHVLKLESMKNNLQKTIGNNESYDKLIIKKFKEIFTKEPGKNFLKWDDKDKFWRAGELGRNRDLSRELSVDAKVINTKDRPETLQKQLIIELENQKIFDQQLPIIIIDDESNKENKKKYLENIQEVKKMYPESSLILINGETKEKDIEMLSRFLHIKIKKEIKKDSILESIFKQGDIKDYLKKNVFYHISGIRNYSILLLHANNLKKIMNFDDDAPPEVYCLHTDDYEELARLREIKKSEVFEKLFFEVGKFLGVEIKDEKSLYNHWALNEDTLKGIEEKYFGYSNDGKKGLVSISVGEIIPLSGPNSCFFSEGNVLFNDEPSDFIENNKKITHQRYQELMCDSISDFNVNISDFLYPRPRKEKSSGDFMVIPVNLMKGAELLGKKAKETSFMFMKRDLRGTYGIPANNEIRKKLQNKIINYVSYPFVLDQDTSAISQLIRYIEIDGKNIANIQHTDQSAILGRRITGFVADTWVIFNRCAFDISIPTPSIGQSLRLEEPPYIKWVKSVLLLLMGKEITTAYSPVGGGQQRDISSRFYVISFQDFNEIIGALSKRYYEKGGKEVLTENYSSEKISSEKSSFEEACKSFGKKYIELSKNIKFDESEKQRLIDERKLRAVLISRLSKERSKIIERLEKEKNKNLETQIADIDLIIIRYSDMFYFYKTKYIKDKERTNLDDDYSPKNREKDYFYKIKIDNGFLFWTAVIPNLILGKREDITNPAPIESKWIALNKTGKINFKDWKKNESIELEKGREIILGELPLHGQEIIVPCLVSNYEKEYLQEIKNKLCYQIKNDGEMLYLWPYIREIMSNESFFKRKISHDFDPNTLKILKENDYFLVEEKVTKNFQEKIKKGLLIDEYNSEKGEIKGSDDVVIFYKLPFEKILMYKALGNKINCAFAFSAGGLSTRTKGLFNPGFKFYLPALKKECSFLELKFMAAKNSLAKKIIIMNSFKTKNMIDELLKENNYFGYCKEDIKIFNQGVQIRLNPDDDFLYEYHTKRIRGLLEDYTKEKISEDEFMVLVRALTKGMKSQFGKAGEFVESDDGLVLSPSGHGDFIRWLVLSNTLVELKRQGIEFIFYSHLNNPSAIITDELKGFFADEINSAKKNGKDVPVLMIFLAENRGEKGGLFVKIKENGKEKLQILESLGFPEELRNKLNSIDKEKLCASFPYFNTGMFLLSIDELFNIMKLPEDYDKKLSYVEILEKVNSLGIKVFVDVKESEVNFDGNRNKKILVGLQLERYLGDYTRIWSWKPVVIDRKKYFVPIKNIEQVDINSDEGKKSLNELCGALRGVENEEEINK